MLSSAQVERRQERILPASPRSQLCPNRVRSPQPVTVKRIVYHITDCLDNSQPHAAAHEAFARRTSFISSWLPASLRSAPRRCSALSGSTAYREGVQDCGCARHGDFTQGSSAYARRRHQALPLRSVRGRCSGSTRTANRRGVSLPRATLVRTTRLPLFGLGSATAVTFATFCRVHTVRLQLSLALNRQRATRTPAARARS